MSFSKSTDAVDLSTVNFNQLVQEPPSNIVNWALGQYALVRRVANNYAFIAAYGITAIEAEEQAGAGAAAAARTTTKRR